MWSTALLMLLPELRIAKFCSAGGSSFKLR